MSIRVLLFLIAFSVSLPAFAQTSIGVLDVDYIMQESKAAKALQKKRNAAREKLLGKLSEKENALRKDGKALFEKRKELGEEAFVKQSKDYEQKLLDMRKLTQKNKRNFEEASAKAIITLRNHVSDVVADIAKEREYEVVLSKRSVIVAGNALDITKDVLAVMDKKPLDVKFAVKD
ncbi:MAG: OmpH family outer membrane protein [Alphaproteobacteria bacterium]